MAYNYRCTTSRCRARRTLPRHAHQYVREPRCWSCGGRLSFDPAVRRQTKKRTCNCGELMYPHRQGTEPWCKHAKVGPAENYFKERYG